MRKHSIVRLIKCGRGVFGGRGGGGGPRGIEGLGGGGIIMSKCKTPSKGPKETNP